MNPSVDVGCPPRPFRHLRMAQRRTPDLSSSRAPVHSALVQKSVTAITNPAGRLSMWMLGNSGALGKWKTRKRWQMACNESNLGFTRSAFCRPSGLIFSAKCKGSEPQSTQRTSAKFAKKIKLGHYRTAAGPQKDLILWANCEFILQLHNIGPKSVVAEAIAARWRSLSDVETAFVRACGRGSTLTRAWGAVGIPVRNRCRIAVGRRDRDRGNLFGRLLLLVRGEAVGSLWQASLAAGFLLADSRATGPDRLHLLFRLSPLSRLYAVAQRHSGVFLGCARHDDAVSGAARSEQWIRLVALLRFCASLRPCAGARTLPALHGKLRSEPWRYAPSTWGSPSLVCWL
jgi:hypothetical protein